MSLWQKYLVQPGKDDERKLVSKVAKRTLGPQTLGFWLRSDVVRMLKANGH